MSRVELQALIQSHKRTAIERVAKPWYRDAYMVNRNIGMAYSVLEAMVDNDSIPEPIVREYVVNAVMELRKLTVTIMQDAEKQFNLECDAAFYTWIKSKHCLNLIQHISQESLRDREWEAEIRPNGGVLLMCQSPVGYSPVCYGKRVILPKIPARFTGDYQGVISFTEQLAQLRTQWEEF